MVGRESIGGDAARCGVARGTAAWPREGRRGGGGGVGANVGAGGGLGVFEGRGRWREVEP